MAGGVYEGEVIQVGDFVFFWLYRSSALIMMKQLLWKMDHAMMETALIWCLLLEGRNGELILWGIAVVFLHCYHGWLLTATTCYSGQMEDTYVEIYTSCDEGVELLYWNDDADCGDETGGNSYL